MAVEPIKKVYLLVHATQEDILLKELQKLSLIQLIGLERLREEGKEASKQLQQIEEIIEFLEQEEREGKKHIFATSESFFGADEAKFSSLIAKVDREKLVDKLQNLKKALQKLAEEKRELEHRLNLLQPWVNLDVPLSVFNTFQKVKVRTGKIASANYLAFISALHQTSPYLEIECVSESPTEKYLLIVYLKSETRIEKCLKSHNFIEIELQEVFRTPQQGVKEINHRLQAITDEEAKIKENIKALIPEKVSLMATYDALNVSYQRDRVKQMLRRTQRTTLVTGWIRQSDLKRLKKVLLSKFKEIEIQIEEPKEDENPPVALSNRTLVKPFEVVTNLYSLPQYREIDPTPFLAPFFAFFFAFCLTDAGYGLLLVLLSLYLRKKLSGGRTLMNLLALSGGVAVILGILTGGVFGIEFEGLLAKSYLLKKFYQTLVILDPRRQPLTFFLVALGCGVIQVLVGIGIKLWDNLRQGCYREALLDQGTWLGLIVGAIGFLITSLSGGCPRSIKLGFLFLAVFSSGGILLFRGRTQRNILKRLLAGVYGLYNAISGTLSDVLSYSRLFALGLATGIIGMVVNITAGMFLRVPIIGLFLFLVVLISGHLFNLVISSLGGFIHTARLQFAEYFTKFYHGGGEPFQPFQEERKYTIIRKEG